MNRRSYLCLYVYDNSKEFKIGIAGFSIYGTKSEKLRFYLGSSSRNFFSPPKLKMPPRALVLYLLLKHDIMNMKVPRLHENLD